MIDKVKRVSRTMPAYDPTCNIEDDLFHHALNSADTVIFVSAINWNAKLINPLVTRNLQNALCPLCSSIHKIPGRKSARIMCPSSCKGCFLSLM